MNALPRYFYEKRNTQNKHITTQIYKTHRAVTKLVAIGYIVLDVQLMGSRPYIEIRFQQRCENLKGVSCGYQKIHGERKERMVSQFCHCDVAWVQPEYVSQLNTRKRNENG